MIQLIDHHFHAILLFWLLAQTLTSFSPMAYVWLNPKMKIWARVVWTVFNGPGAWLALAIVGAFSLGGFLVYKFFDGKKSAAG